MATGCLHRQQKCGRRQRNFASRAGCTGPLTVPPLVFGAEAIKPYTHATFHLHQFQLKPQYDLKDY
jgi:hypothetical protein